jgi:hypothetical protein
LRVLSAGGTLHDIDDRDWDDLPDLGPGFAVEAAWRHEVARLEVRLSGSSSGRQRPASSPDHV